MAPFLIPFLPDPAQKVNYNIILHVNETNNYVCLIDTWRVCVYSEVMESEQIYKNLGIRIRDLRKALGRTQDQLAKQVGISRASLANIEAGRQQVLVHHLFGLADALQLESPATLLLLPRPKSKRDGAASDLRISGDGLTEKQRREVLNLMGGALNSHDAGAEEREDE